MKAGIEKRLFNVAVLVSYGDDAGKDLYSVVVEGEDPRAADDAAAEAVLALMHGGSEPAKTWHGKRPRTADAPIEMEMFGVPLPVQEVDGRVLTGEETGWVDRTLDAAEGPAAAA